MCEPLERRAYLTIPHWSNFEFKYETGHSQVIDFDIDVRPNQIIRDGIENTDLIVQKDFANPNDSFIPSDDILLSNPAPGMQGTFTYKDQPALPFSGTPPRTDILPDGNYRASIEI